MEAWMVAGVIALVLIAAFLVVWNTKTQDEIEAEERLRKRLNDIAHADAPKSEAPPPAQDKPAVNHVRATSVPNSAGAMKRRRSRKKA